MTPSRLTPDEAQLVQALMIATTGHHQLLVEGSPETWAFAVRWTAEILPMLNRDEAEAVAGPVGGRGAAQGVPNA